MRLNALIALIGFAGFTDTTDSQLSWELIGCAQLTIHQLLQLKLVSRVSSRGYLSHIVRGLVKGVHCLKQSLMLFSCGCKLQEHRLFHRTSVQIMRETVNGRGRRNAIPPRPQGLILTQILQTEVKSQMSALNKRLQREPAFPDGSPARRAIMGACQIATQAGYLRPEGAHRHARRRAATQLRQDGQHQRLNHLLRWVLGVLPSHRTHLQQAHSQRGQQTRASASGRPLGALAVPRCDTHF